MRSQAEKGRMFRELHKRSGLILLPNPWDAGTAKLLQSLGFEALATTSLGMSNALGRVDGDGAVSRAELLENCRVIAGATDLPVNADLENGYADDPKEAATILRDAAAVGIVGGSIEDWSGERIYDFNHAVERVAAGADVLYAPGLHDLETMRMVASAVTKPLNVVMSAGDPDLTAEQIAATGVKRISVGGALSRLALAAFMKGANDMKAGSFLWMRDTMATSDLKKVFRG